MPRRYYFDPDVLHSVAGGRSALDIQRLHIKTFDEAEAFIKVYGFDLNLIPDVEKLWYYYRRALVFLQEKLGYSLQDIPEIFHDRKHLKDLRLLLLWSSESQASSQQKWSCALLRVIHVFVHSENDLFSSFAHEIQQQILEPFQKFVVHDAKKGIYLKGNLRDEEIPLSKFEIKPFKTSSSTVVKLLAKPDALAMKVFDKVGVRLITHHVFDAFRVIRFLAEENIVSLPHIMPDQSSNNIFPVDLFLRALNDAKNLNENWNVEQIDDYLLKRFAATADKEMLRKENKFSADSYRFIKFIGRQLIRVHPENSRHKESFSFFYPFEVQILDMSSYEKNQKGASQHQAYKERQIEGARRRVFQDTSRDS